MPGSRVGSARASSSTPTTDGYSVHGCSLSACFCPLTAPAYCCRRHHHHQRSRSAPSHLICRGAYLAPWSVAPGSCCYNNTPGLPQYDLTGWNQTYFDRLRAYLQYAGSKGIVVNLGLFCVFYGGAQPPIYSAEWPLSPMYPSNNINGVGGNVSEPNDIYRGLHPEIETLMALFIAKVLSEVGDLDNFFFEVINEPFAATPKSGDQLPDNLFLAWQSRMIDAISQYDTRGHTISQNWANGAARLFVGTPNGPDTRTRYVSFHYTDPTAITMNRAHGQFMLPLGTSETGFEGTGDYPYRARAWSTMLSGAATYSNLDYSWTAYHPDGGNYPVQSGAPGGGGPLIRQQLSILRSVMANDLPLQYMAEAKGVVCAGFNGWPPMANLQFYALADVLAPSAFTQHSSGPAGGMVTLNLTTVLIYINNLYHPLYAPGNELPVAIQVGGSLPSAAAAPLLQATGTRGVNDNAAAVDPLGVDHAGAMADAPTWTVTMIDTITGNRTVLANGWTLDINGMITVSVPAPGRNDTDGNDVALLVSRVS